MPRNSPEGRRYFLTPASTAMQTKGENPRQVPTLFQEECYFGWESYILNRHDYEPKIGPLTVVSCDIILGGIPSMPSFVLHNFASHAAVSKSQGTSNHIRRLFWFVGLLLLAISSIAYPVIRRQSVACSDTGAGFLCVPRNGQITRIGGRSVVG